MATYKTTARWTGGHSGEVSLSNGPVLPFSAPADIKGVAGVLTPEDAFVAALNTCYALMFIWSVERLKIDLVSYTCEAEGHVEEFLDRTSTFDAVTLRPKIVSTRLRRGEGEARPGAGGEVQPHLAVNKGEGHTRAGDNPSLASYQPPFR